MKLQNCDDRANNIETTCGQCKCDYKYRIYSVRKCPNHNVFSECMV